MCVRWTLFLTWFKRLSVAVQYDLSNNNKKIVGSNLLLLHLVMIHRMLIRIFIRLNLYLVLIGGLEALSQQMRQCLFACSLPPNVLRFLCTQITILNFKMSSDKSTGCDLETTLENWLFLQINNIRNKNR